MSIDQMASSDKTPLEDNNDGILEGEFDIVPLGSSQSKPLKEHFINVLILVLVASASFGIGKISSIKADKTPVTIESITPIEQVRTNAPQTNVKSSINTAAVVGAQNGEVVASKNGTKYHYPWCPGAQQISAQNKISFKSVEEARAAGYSPAANCKGLK